MADYFTQFSCVLDVGSAENVVGALLLYRKLEAELDRDQHMAIGFAASADDDVPSMVWLRDDDGFGDPEHVIVFALRCAERFDLGGRWGFVWGLTCSKSRLDGFGGGAQLLDLGARTSLAWLDCNTWLFALLEPEADPAIGVVCA